MHRVRMLKHFGVTPYMVFDGDFLPSKASTEAARAKRREESKAAGLALLKAGKPSQAYQELQKAIDITPEMARHLIEELKKMNVPYVVAPYEADSQMVYLERQGMVTGIISEDSDLLVFGAKRLLTKLDPHGQCVEINRRDFCACREISLTGWTDAQFRQMAIFSGCDYLESIGNMGLKTAYRMLRKHKTPERVIRMLQFDGKYRVSENYLAQFKQAELTFMHQRVFCPKKQGLVLLTDVETGIDVEEMAFIGAKVPDDMAQAIASGELNPITKQPIVLAPLPGRPRQNQNQAGFQSNSLSKQAVKKPIDSYFNGQNRIPMGEMDPNCFAVDRQQVAALTQNGLTPRVFPLPRPYLDQPSTSTRNSPEKSHATSRPLRRRRTDPEVLIPGVFSTPTGQRRLAGRLARTPTESCHADRPSSTRPAKKARLCEDVGLEIGSSENFGQSKFFSVAKPRKSVPTSPGTILMSDDSIEEALRDLPDIDTWNSSRSSRSSQTLEIFQEDTQITIPDSPLPPSQASGKQGCKAGDDVEGFDHSPSTSKTIKPDDDAIGHSPRVPRGILRQFSYTPANMPSKVTNFAHGLPTPVSSEGPSDAKVGAQSANKTLLTPLQRIGARALTRSQKLVTPSPTSKGHKGSQSSIKSAMCQGKPSVPAFPVNPSFVPLPKVDLEEVASLNRPMGSEDYIVPASDGEDDDASSSEPVIEEDTKRLDLSRFLFA